MTTYLSVKQVRANFGYCSSTVWNLIHEIRDQIDAGRYETEAILDGCGVRIREDILIDYLKYRKQLKQAPQYVPAFKNVIPPLQAETPMAEIIEDYSKRKEMRH